MLENEIRDKLYDKSTILTEFNINPPQRPRQTVFFKKQMNQREAILAYLKDSTKVEELTKKSN